MENTLTSLHISTHTVIEEPKVRYCTSGDHAEVNRRMIERVCERCGKPFKVPEWRFDKKWYCKACSPVTVKCRDWEDELGEIHLGCGKRVRVTKYIAGEMLNEKTGELEKVILHYPVNCPGCGNELPMGTRGEITRFSEDSRRRLMRLLAKLDSATRPHFVTLTFPDTYTEYQDPEDWKRILNVFVMRFIRKFPSGSFIWRLETIDRKSGEHIHEIFPHFHLLVFGVEFNELKFWLPGAWYETVGTGDSEHLEHGYYVSRVLSRRGVFRYASKTVGETMSREMGKAVQALGKVGRWWGIVLRDNFNRFMSPVEELILDERQAIQVIRYFRRLSHGFGRAYSRLTTFISGSWLVKNIIRMVAPDENRNSYLATDRRYDIPFWLHACYFGWLVPQLE